MSPFDHVSILFSILMGLAFARLLGGAGRCVFDPDRSLHWLPALWTVNVIVFQITLWWLVFARAGQETWSFAHYVVTTSYPLILYTQAVLLYPEVDAREGTAKAFLDRRAWFFGLWIALFGIDTVENAMAGVRLQGRNWIGVGVVAGLMMSGAIVRHRAWHAVLGAIVLLIMLATAIQNLPSIQ